MKQTMKKIKIHLTKTKQKNAKNNQITQKITKQMEQS